MSGTRRSHKIQPRNTEKQESKHSFILFYPKESIIMAALNLIITKRIFAVYNYKEIFKLYLCVLCLILIYKILSSKSLVLKHLKLGVVNFLGFIVSLNIFILAFLNIADLALLVKYFLMVSGDITHLFSILMVKFVILSMSICASLYFLQTRVFLPLLKHEVDTNSAVIKILKSVLMVLCFNILINFTLFYNLIYHFISMLIFLLYIGVNVAWPIFQLNLEKSYVLFGIKLKFFVILIGSVVMLFLFINQVAIQILLFNFSLNSFNGRFLFAKDYFLTTSWDFQTLRRVFNLN
ncbi:hypothetical protein TUBRATIS_003460 [Tubulinosema ratisbonensis]|uniref:Uncharacterized protein n=1 Tax=Tubulinosema ratisbonensis TaxID=291195 RepID=A0A437AQ36_9MICR|nr:hypothetical protein TUBRATIS_003460 [Tubulinosema ratisbonensis]